MEKISIDLFKVHESFKVKFNVVIRSDLQTNLNKTNTYIINKFTYNGNKYTNLTPHPFLTIDITSKMDKNEGWSANNSVNLTRRDCFNFVQRMTRLYTKFTKITDLFYYDNNDILVVNKELSEMHKEVFVCGNKTILLQACVVDDSKSKLKYEGIFLSINSIDYFSYLTYSEMEFLIYELRKVDFNSLTMQLINTHMISDSIESEKLKLPEKPPLVENKSEEIIDNKTRIGLPKPNTIPEI